MSFEIGREYAFVRNAQGTPEHATFIRFEDGSAVVDDDGGAVIWEESEDAWQLALSDLRSRGFLEEHA
jgi:hypothetical protein